MKEKEPYQHSSRLDCLSEDYWGGWRRTVVRPFAAKVELGAAEAWLAGLEGAGAWLLACREGVGEGEGEEACDSEDGGCELHLEDWEVILWL